MKQESYKDIIARESKDRNWITRDEAEKIRDGILQEFPDAVIDITEEHFAVTGLNGGTVMIPRWRKIPTSKDGKHFDGGNKEIIETLRSAIEIKGE